ncbi:3-deoxy-manno-octulosonate cytidylyltransferase [Thioalkalivibrio paradoxus]|uniref:3-deoxy-manno-octulosonate cytidylyltransferase n=1 Tax=Thioalkalivibrio paradoxus ARh 1 TaxID=713585 RepID=W0DNP1_9GAMM|nr:3-deoxy-manno-octulosonate cytidylyltransferase [Thioalkalivibrio paradoxus]AHE98867.1 3-deoxy-manno-octulosonate cytidylyltransferase [Thioalkalivibrio paradoxus ARh 1]
MSAEPFIVVIPARMASSRLPGKPLVAVAGRPLIAHVVARARESSAARVIVASDDARVLDVAHASGAEACWTPSDLPSGTDRIAAVAAEQRWPDATCVVNLQGDEPLTPGTLLDELAALLARHPRADMATLGVPIRSAEDLHDPNQVKLVTDAAGRALYFSRAPIPWDREAARAGHSPDLTQARRHLGLYAYRARFLRRLTAEPPAALERIEQLEQLRALAIGAWIQVGIVDAPVPAGVDTPEDVERLERLMAATAQV